MLTAVKRIITNLFSRPNSGTAFRFVKENKYDEVALEVFTHYFVEKKEGLNWYEISPKFEDYDKMVKWFASYKEYISNRGTHYEYVKN